MYEASWHVYCAEKSSPRACEERERERERAKSFFPLASSPLPSRAFPYIPFSGATADSLVLSLLSREGNKREMKDRPRAHSLSLRVSYTRTSFALDY